MMHQKPGNPGFTTFVRASHARPRILPAASETRKLEQETHEKMRKLADIRSTIAAERQMTEELRREVSSKGWSSLNPMPPSYEKSMKPVKTLLQQPPPSNFRIKRRSSTFKSPDAYLNENKFAKYGAPPGHLQNMNHHGCPPNDFEAEEEAHCTSAMEALKEWHNSQCINPTDVEQNIAKPQQQFQSEPVPISCWEESNENHGTCRPMEIDTIPEEEPDRAWTTVNTQTEKPKALAEVESKPPTTIEGTYFQHLFLHQSYHRKVQA